VKRAWAISPALTGTTRHAWWPAWPAPCRRPTTPGGCHRCTFRAALPGRPGPHHRASSWT